MVSRKQGLGHRGDPGGLTVVAVPDRAHRGHQPGSLGALGERPGGELHTPVDPLDSAEAGDAMRTVDAGP